MAARGAKEPHFAPPAVVQRFPSPLRGFQTLCLHEPAGLRPRLNSGAAPRLSLRDLFSTKRDGGTRFTRPTLRPDFMTRTACDQRRGAAERV